MTDAQNSFFWGRSRGKDNLDMKIVSHDCHGESSAHFCSRGEHIKFLSMDLMRFTLAGNGIQAEF